MLYALGIFVSSFAEHNTISVGEGRTVPQILCWCSGVIPACLVQPPTLATNTRISRMHKICLVGCSATENGTMLRWVSLRFIFQRTPHNLHRTGLHDPHPCTFQSCGSKKGFHVGVSFQRKLSFSQPKATLLGLNFWCLSWFLNQNVLALTFTAVKIQLSQIQRQISRQLTSRNTDRYWIHCKHNATEMTTVYTTTLSSPPPRIFLGCLSGDPVLQRASSYSKHWAIVPTTCQRKNWSSAGKRNGQCLGLKEHVCACLPARGYCKINA